VQRTRMLTVIRIVRQYVCVVGMPEANTCRYKVYVSGCIGRVNKAYVMNEVLASVCRLNTRSAWSR
jgi:hypothetical protein